jgi:hypothetical protein
MKTQPDQSEMQVALLASSLDTKFWPMVPSPAGYQQAKGSCPTWVSSRMTRRRQVAMPGVARAAVMAGLLAHCALKCCPLVLCTIPCFQG